MHREVHVLCSPIPTHETGRGVAIGEEQVADLVGHRVPEHDDIVEVVVSTSTSRLQIRPRDALDVSAGTVMREWKLAKAWLLREMNG